MRRIALTLLAASLLCACGQRGGLYLPGSDREAVGPAATPVAAPAPATPATGAAESGASAEEREREREAAARNRTN